MRFFVALVVFVLIAAVAYFLLGSTKGVEVVPPVQDASQNEGVNIEAKFAIYTNGVFRIFTAGMYHNISDEVYIEATNPNTVLVKKEGVTWGEFFETLPMKLSRDCLVTGNGESYCTKGSKKLKFYINGEQREDALDNEILAGDRLLVSYGSDSNVEKQIEKLEEL